MPEIHYKPGDATTPSVKGPKLIAHLCNDRGGWGRGFVLAISARWPEPEKAYRKWYRERSTNDFALGAVQVVQVAPPHHRIWVANMVGQHGVKTGSAGPPVRYDAIDQCLKNLADRALELEASVHMPRIGCGLAGGKWERIEPLISARLCDLDISVTVYDHT
ncbi:MAG: macro domain-containing protein [Catenulispora sp.]|nr:macro domain-containing protein [Catenulispora sp.]